jgi:hypothetical protein
MSLSKNMRADKESADFKKWLLSIGSGYFNTVEE